MHANITSKVLRVVTLAGGLLMIVGTPTGQLHAWDSRDLKGAVVEEVRNEHAPFLVRVDVDHPDRLYRQGDTMTVTVQSEKAGYLYLFYFTADGARTTTGTRRTGTTNSSWSTTVTSRTCVRSVARF